MEQRDNRRNVLRDEDDAEEECEQLLGAGDEGIAACFIIKREEILIEPNYDTNLW